MRIFGFIMVLFVLAVFPIAAGGGQQGGSQSASGTPSTVGPNEYPAAMTVYGQIDTRVTNTGATSNNEIGSFRALEKATGTKIEWIYAPNDGTLARQDFTLLIASGKLPDLIRYNWSNAPGGVLSYYEDKVIINLSSLLKTHMPNVDRLIDERNIRRNLIYNTSDILFIPEIRKEAEMNVFRGPVIREDWLEKLNLRAPRTLDELYNVLITFRDRKPGGADVWAMSGMRFEFGNFSIDRLMWPFGISSSFYQVNGRIKYGPMEPEFTEAITFINKLYSEGLLDPDYSTQERAALDGKFMNNQAGFEFGMQPSTMNNTMDPTGSGFRAVGIEWLRKDLNSPAYVFDPEFTSYMLISNAIAITSAAREPEKIANWINFLFSDQGAIITNYGEEGVAYTMSGGKPVFTQEFLNSGTNSVRYNFAATSIFPSLRLWDTYSRTLHQRGAASIENWAKNTDLSRLLPALPFTAEEEQSINERWVDLKAYTLENVDRLISGRLRLNEIPAFQARLRSMGIQNVIDTYQKAYDRFMSK